MTGQGTKNIPKQTLVALCDEAGGVTVTEAYAWISRGWLDIGLARRPSAGHATLVARLVLIRELRQDMGVAEDTLDLVLDLIDKLRLQTDKLNSLNAAIDEAPSAPAATVRTLAAQIFRARMDASVDPTEKPS